MPTCILKDIPNDIFDFILDVQHKIKKERKINQFSFESAIYKIINDSRKCVEENMRIENEGKKK